MSDGDNIDNQKKKQYDQLINLILTIESKGLQVKTANLGRIRGEYYRGKDLEKYINDNLEYISSELEKITGNKVSDIHNELYKLMRAHAILVKSVRTEGDKMKYPKRLIPLEGGVPCCDDDDHHSMKKEDLTKFDSNMFYIVNIDRGQKKLYIYLGLTIFAILMYCLMPIWPLFVKLAIWYVSYILLVILVAINIVRYSVFTICYIFGLSFWIFPDLYDDKKGVIDSFKPLYKYEKRQENFMTIFIRLSIFLTVMYSAYCVYENPNMLDDLYEHLFEVGKDVFDWGENYVINYHNGTALSLKNQKYKNILNEEVDL